MLMRPKFTKVTVAIMVMAIVAVVAGFAAGVLVTGGDGGREQSLVAPGAVGSVFPGAAESTDSYDSGGAADSSARTLKGVDEAQAPADAAPSGQEQLIIRNAGLELRVDDVTAAVERVRIETAKLGGVVADLSVFAGDMAPPRPLDSGSSAVVQGPATATMTLRVPADKLDALENAVARVGRVITQSSSANDVTQEHIDLSARLKNLRAEEARLRAFMNRATKVSDLLAVERELARVRGEIEAMQAQLDYLDRQVARATLTVSMSEPGPVVQPDGPDWGFTDAIRRGVRGAVAVLTSLVTVLIALAPLAVIAAIAVVFWRLVRRRSRRTSMEQGADGGGDIDAVDSAEDR